MSVIKVDYGKVETGKTVVKTVEILNEGCRKQIFEARRNAMTNPLDHVFQLNSYTWCLASKEKFLLEISYRPFLAFSTNIDYFDLLDRGEPYMKIIARGSSIGPEVTCSATKVVILCTNKNEGTKKRIKLTNNSKMRATFMFDIDENHESFKLDLMSGFINSHSYKYITITFTPPEVGRYVYILPCLILYQDPIIIELYGYCGMSSSLKEDVSCLNYPWKMKNGFQGYMSDCVNATKNLPLVSLSKNYFDFGQTDVSAENSQQGTPQALCLTNHSQSNFLVRWEKDPEEIFNITPCMMQVKASQSILFEISFNPSTKSNLFSRGITCLIFPEIENHKENKSVAFPFVTSISAIGHSFPIGSDGWIPQYEVPPVIIMPPCVPLLPVYTTFVIKRLGHLPLMFQFVPPSTSRFRIKPMLGVIYKDFQIIALEMIPKPEDKQMYVERWAIYFNGNTKKERSIDFKGYAESAKVSFSNNNIAEFHTVYPGCQLFKEMLMRNVTRHTLRYEFQELPASLNIQYRTGEIYSNEILVQEWSFCPSESDTSYDFGVECELIAVKNAVTIGSKAYVTVRVLGRSEIGFLEAVPSELHFGEVMYNKEKILRVKIFNSSIVDIFYKIKCSHRGWPIGNLEEDVKVWPASETLFAKSTKTINVSIKPRTPGFYEFVVQYLVRTNFKTENLIWNEVPKSICNVSCMCTLPTIKVENMTSYGIYSHMSKRFLWKSMQINEFNEMLKNILPGEKKTLSMYFERIVVNEEPFFIKLVIKNPLNIAVRWSLKRTRRCSCKPIIKKKGMSFRCKEFNCPHDKICSVNPKSGILDPKKIVTISITLRYLIVGKLDIDWDLDIDYDRHIILNMIIECLSGSERELYFLSGKLLKFGRIYFGKRNAMYKTHWIYNPTNNDLSYFINVNPLRQLNEKNLCEIFACVTPDGVVEARSLKPIIFKFQPRMFGAYKVSLPVKMGDKETELILEGESSSDAEYKEFYEEAPTLCSHKIKDFPIYFSRDYIDVRSIGTHDRIVKMLLVHNNWKEDTLAYEWENKEIPGMLRVEIFPRKGMVQPKSLQSFRVQIYSKEYSGTIAVDIPGKFFNASQKRIYRRNVLKHDLLSEELEGQFTITEKGVKIPKATTNIAEDPAPYYKILTVHCYVHSIEDENLQANLTKKLNRAPSSNIYIDDKEKECSVTDGKELSISSSILEDLLWDILNSSTLKNIIQETFMAETNLFYTEFTMNLSERKKLEKRAYTSPPYMLIDSILEKLLFFIVLDEFSLETVHLMPQDDIRHNNFLKMGAKNERKTSNEGLIIDSREDVIMLDLKF